MQSIESHSIRPMHRRTLLPAIVLAAALATGTHAQAAGEVNIYSYREPALIEPLLKAFTAATGIKANTVFAKDGLIERLAAEARNSPADVLLTVDAARLSEAKAAQRGAHPRKIGDLRLRLHLEQRAADEIDAEVQAQREIERDGGNRSDRRQRKADAPEAHEIELGVIREEPQKR